MSKPAVTLSHSTNTVPLKSLAFSGRYTTIRVLYGAVVVGRSFQRPSSVKGFAASYAVAVPPMKYSSAT